MGMGYDEKYGGTTEGIDIFHGIVTAEEFAQGCGGVSASLLSHNIAFPHWRTGQWLLHRTLQQ